MTISIFAQLNKIQRSFILNEKDAISLMSKFDKEGVFYVAVK